MAGQRITSWRRSQPRDLSDVYAIRAEISRYLTRVPLPDWYGRIGHVRVFDRSNDTPKQLEPAGCYLTGLAAPRVRTHDDL